MEEATTSPSTSTIITRLSFITSLLFISMYANYESSKHFDITVSADADSYQHRKFSLLFISNGRASRILLESNIQMQKILDSNSLYAKDLKYVKHVHIQLANGDLHAPVMVDNGFRPDMFVITLNPNLMIEKNVVEAVEIVLKKAMVQVLMWCQNEGMMEMMVRSLMGTGAKEDDMIRLWLEKKLTVGEDCVARSAVGSRQVI